MKKMQGGRSLPDFGKFKSRVLDSVRRGPNEVNWTPPALGFGNHLYMWLHAWKRQQAGVKSCVLIHKSMEPWLSTFPELRRLSVSRRDVGFFDRRFISSGQSFGTEFSELELQGFISSCLLESTSFKAELSRARQGLAGRSLVVNVRRGDYYSVPEFCTIYGMNIESFVQEAVSRVAAEIDITGVRVVSDDPKWCRDNLGVLNDYGPVDYGTEERTPLRDLATLAAADTLILANSTFSYWGAYINNVLRSAQSPCNVWAPAFHGRHPASHSRYVGEGLAWQLDPNWNVIDDLPYGWEPRDLPSRH